MSGSNIASIVDYTAALVGREVSGVKSVWGAGQGVYDDPLHPGHKIQPAGGNPREPFTHWSELPDAPVITWETQSGTVRIDWKLPMRLWLPKADLAETRRVALPFYDRYLRAFVLDPRLGGLALGMTDFTFDHGGDDDWAWLGFGLTIAELVNYGV